VSALRFVLDSTPVPDSASSEEADKLVVALPVLALDTAAFVVVPAGILVA
jgi:hypothetical protein